jgi:hypothetical protein
VNKKLQRQWQRWQDELCEQALAGPHGELVRQLLEVLDGLGPRDGAVLLDFVRSQSWRDVNMDTRFVCLHEINARTITLREQAGLVPFERQP